MPFDRAYFNSFYISILVVLCELLTCSMAAYAFAKIRFRGSNLIFIAFIATMMVPKQVIIIALYVIMKQINWLDSHLALIVPEGIFKAFGVFMLRQFIKGLPKELEEAAVIDGANPLKIYWLVILPLTRTALAAFGIFAFKDIWNQFMEPLIFLSTPEKYTVPLLLNMFKGLYVADWPLMMAGTTIAVVPVLIVYIMAQKQIIEGIAMTGSKG
jgi:multiple sugar transport system permease protein